MKLLLKISTIALSFLLVFVILPKPSHAELNVSAIADLVSNFPKNNIYTALNDFCSKRSGELMNLETWFSGKCDPETYSLSGEGVGFADIVFMQLIEAVKGPQYKTLPGQMMETVESLMGLQASNNIDDFNSGIAKLQGAEMNQDIVSKMGLAIQKTFEFKPASTTEYLAYITNNLKNHKIIDSAYAAENSYGFRALSPILPLWKAFRNIAYMLFAIAFIMYGVMIMFRVRIDGKTAATITLAIPKLVTTLLLITFSYAIVGLLIDISTIATAISIDVLRVGGLIEDSNNFFIKLAGGTNLGIFGSFVVNFFSSVLVTPFIIFNMLIGGFTGIVLASITFIASWFTGVGTILTLVLYVAIGFSYFKLVLKLFQSYLSVIISLIFSPIILLGDIIPGQKSFTKWITNIFGNLAVFPTVSFLLTLSYILMLQPIVSLFGLDGQFFGVKNLSTEATALWTPPLTIPANFLTSGTTNAAIGNAVPALMLATLGVGLLLMSSKYVDMITEALKVEPFKYGTAIGEALKHGYNEVKDPESSFGRGGLGKTARRAEGRYDNSIGLVTENTIYQDAGRLGIQQDKKS